MKPNFFVCGTCGFLHVVGPRGELDNAGRDCRDNTHRFSFDQLDARYGPDGYTYLDEGEVQEAYAENVS